MKKIIYYSIILIMIYSNDLIAQQQDSWITFTTAQGLAANDVCAIVEASDGALWFGTFEGVSRYQAGSWTSFTMADGLAYDYVTAIVEASDGALWFGTYGGVSRYQAGSWTSFTMADGLAHNFVTAIVEASDGALWFGTRGGVSRYQAGSWTSFTTADGLVVNYVRAIVEASDGALWFGTWGGVSRYQAGSWTSFTRADGLAANDVRAIVEASDGALWFGTWGGVSRYQAGSWTNFAMADGLAANDVRAIVEASDGALWFGTYNKGISRVKPDKKPPQTFILTGPGNNDIVGTSTPLFIYGAIDYRTDLYPPQFSWAILDANNNLVCGDSLKFAENAIVQPDIQENGIYVFKVKAKDKWGNIDPTPATRTFTVDITQPTVTINSPIANGIAAGKTAIIGSAFDSSPIRDFREFRLQYAFGTKRELLKESDWKADHFSGMKSNQEIRNDTLAIWNTEGLRNGAYLLQLSAYDTLDHESYDFVKVEVVSGSQLVDSRHGSNFASGKIEIYIPPNAVPKDLQINVRDSPIEDIKPKEDPQITFIGFCFKIESVPAYPDLAKPATLSLIYPDSLIANKSEQQLALYYSPDGKDNWQRLGGSVDLEKNIITTTFKQFGVFALYEDLTEGGKAGILNVNSQPRIFSPQGGGHESQTAISFELGKESNVTIKIYNPAGRLVKVLTESEPMSHGNNVVYWDGKDQQGEFCLSGLYIVTIQAAEKMATKTVVVLNK